MKYRVEFEFDGWFATEVEASSKDEAREKAEAELLDECDYVKTVTQVDVMDNGDDEECNEE